MTTITKTKQYEYKIYDFSWNVVGVLSDVADHHPVFAYDVNGGLGALRLTINRHRSKVYTCNDLIPGNHIVVTEKNGGTKVYSGRIMRVNSVIGTEKSQVSIECVGYVQEWAVRLVELSDGTTGLMATGDDPTELFSHLITLSGGNINAGTIETSGVSADLSVNGAYVLDAVEKIMERLPNDWYWYVDATRKAHIRQVRTTPDHILTLGREIQNLEFTSKMDNVINDVLIIGGTPDGEEQIVARSKSQASIDTYGKRQRVVIDGRLTSTTSINYIANSHLSPSVDMEVRFDVLDDAFSSRGYDIESIKPGDSIRIKDRAGSNDGTRWDEDNWDESYWDAHPNEVFDSVLVVKRITYRGTHITVEVSDRLPSVAHNLATVKRNQELFMAAGAPITTTVTT